MTWDTRGTDSSESERRAVHRDEASQSEAAAAALACSRQGDGPCRLAEHPRAVGAVFGGGAVGESEGILIRFAGVRRAHRARRGGLETGSEQSNWKRADLRCLSRR